MYLGAFERKKKERNVLIISKVKENDVINFHRVYFYYFFTLELFQETSKLMSSFHSFKKNNKMKIKTWK